MYISRFQLGNYKSFREPVPLEFTTGFNIISGQNNAGKTALLEALGLTFFGRPHRSTTTVPARDTIPDQTSWADVSFTMPVSEVREFIRASGQSQFRIARARLDSDFARHAGCIDDSNHSTERLLDAVFSQGSLTFELRAEARVGQGVGWEAAEMSLVRIVSAV